MPGKRGLVVFEVSGTRLDGGDFGGGVVDGHVDMPNIKIQSWHQLNTGDLGDMVKNLLAVPCVKNKRGKPSNLVSFGAEMIRGGPGARGGVFRLPRTIATDHVLRKVRLVLAGL